MIVDKQYIIEAFQPYATILIVVAAYSLVINCLFGHKTYWRSVKNFDRLTNYMQSMLKKLSFGRSPIIISSLEWNKLEYDVSMCVLSYLAPNEILSLLQTCKAQAKICDSLHLWQDKFEKILEKAKEIDLHLDFPYKLSSVPMSPHESYFLLCKHLVKLVLQSSTACHVMIRGNIYNLSDFKFQHPGGVGILEDSIGRDATREFGLANHSWVALQLAKNFLVLSHVDVFGRRKGLPYFVKKYGENGDDIQSLISTLTTLEAKSVER